MARLAKLALLLSLLALAGCLTLDGDDEPILSIELYWDALPTADSFLGATCDEAGVERMEWALYDERGDELRSNSEPCADAIDVLHSEPGEYELDVTGLDEDGEPLWAVTCTGLRVLRFDVAFECDIPAGS